MLAVRGPLCRNKHMTTGRINQVTASVLTGPGGPHRRAPVRFDTTPCFPYRGSRCQPPDGYVFASPAERTSTSSSIAHRRPLGPAAPMPGTTS